MEKLARKRERHFGMDPPLGFYLTITALKISFHLNALPPLEEEASGRALGGIEKDTEEKWVAFTKECTEGTETWAGEEKMKPTP